jgi:cytosolic phospholipase A2
MNYWIKLQYSSLLFFASIYADIITINNTTTRDLYAAIYYQAIKLPFINQSDAQIATIIQCIDAQSSATLNRPDFWFGYNRQLVFVEDLLLLTPSLNNDFLDQYHSKNVGMWQGNTFYLGDDEGDIYAYTELEWDVVQMPLQYAQQELLNFVPAITNNPYKNRIAKVRQGNGLCDQEKAFLNNRIPYVTKAISEFLNNPFITKTPTIALVCSGGGYRSMLFTTGVLKGLNELHLIDAITYLVGLSGSTWAIAPWISSSKSIDYFHDWLIDNIGFDMQNCDEDDFTLIGNTLLIKYCTGQPSGFVDIYGACIANDVLDVVTDNKIEAHISDQGGLIADGSLPLPIYTAISAENSADESLWYECTPYEIGASWLNAYIPTWAFGRKFRNGISVTSVPEQTMGTLLGTFGLAVGITFKRMIQEVNLEDNMKSLLLKKLVARLLKKYGDDRPISAEYLNFVTGMQEVQFNTLSLLQMVDAGINCNLPFPPISGERIARKADIIIFVDASAGAVGNELHKVENYAHLHQLPFPIIDYSLADKQAVSIFKDETDANIPIVIYIPRVVDHVQLENHKNDQASLYTVLHDFDIETCITNEVCNTFNFQYSPQEARKLTALGEFNILMAHDAIRQALIFWMKK